MNINEYLKNKAKTVLFMTTKFWNVDFKKTNPNFNPHNLNFCYYCCRVFVLKSKTYHFGAEMILLIKFKAHYPEVDTTKLEMIEHQLLSPDECKKKLILFDIADDEKNISIVKLFNHILVNDTYLSLPNIRLSINNFFD